VRAILFGATGMVGQAVLRECLVDDGVEAVLAVGRRTTGVTHPKLRELLRADLFDVDVPESSVAGYDACFFCLGVSSVGMSEAEYTRLTFDLTMGWARALALVSPSLAFCYVSGAGTGGKAMWARVKGRTESALLDLFPRSYMVRLAALLPMHGEAPRMRGARALYAVARPLLPLIRAVAPNAVVTTEELGRAMIRVAREGFGRRVLEASDLRALGGRRE